MTARRGSDSRRRSKNAEQDVRLIWDTLSADIKRHEESHVIIAKNHGREMEQALKGIGRQKNCQIAAAKAKAISARLLEKHDRAQLEFDRVEGWPHTMDLDSGVNRHCIAKMFEFFEKHLGAPAGSSAAKD